MEHSHCIYAHSEINYEYLAHSNFRTRYHRWQIFPQILALWGVVVCLYVTKTAQNNHQTHWSSVENVQKDMYWHWTPFASDNYMHTLVTKKTVSLTLLLRLRAVCRIKESNVLRLSLKALYKLPLTSDIKKKQKEEEKVASSTATWTCHRYWRVRFDPRKKQWLKFKKVKKSEWLCEALYIDLEDLTPKRLWDANIPQDTDFRGVCFFCFVSFFVLLVFLFSVAVVVVAVTLCGWQTLKSSY